MAGGDDASTSTSASSVDSAASERATVTAVSRLRPAYRHVVLAIAVGALFATMIARLAISPVVPSIIDEFGTSPGAVGLALTGLWAAYAVAQFPGGVLGERYGERRVVLAALGSTAVASALLAAAPTFPAFALVAVFLGAGAGLYFAAATSLLTELFADTGGVLGIHEIGASVGALVAPVAAVAITERFGWRAAPLLGAVATLAAFLLVLVRVRATPPARPDVPLRRRFDVRALGSVLVRPPVAFTVCLAVTGAFVWQAYAAFFPTFLVEARGRSATVASGLFGAGFALSIGALPALGRLSDAIGRDAALALAFSLVGGGIAVVVAIPGFPAAVAGTALIGVGFGWPGIVQSRAMDHLSPDERASGFGLIRSVYLLLGATGSAVTGAVADLLGWRAAYALLAGVSLAGVAALCLNWVTKRRS